MIDALMALVAESDVVPSVALVAERAGVSTRAVFKHFGTIDGLCAAAAHDALTQSLTRIAGVDPDLPIGERLQRFVAIRVGVQASIAPLYPHLCAGGNRVNLGAIGVRSEIVRLFDRELARMSDARRSETIDTADALVSLGALLHLVGLGYGPAKIRRIVEAGLATIFTSPLLKEKTAGA